jgi:hypothetical protein
MLGTVADNAESALLFEEILVPALIDVIVETGETIQLKPPPN